jgi:hypothetical protein
MRHAVDDVRRPDPNRLGRNADRLRRTLEQTAQSTDGFDFDGGAHALHRTKLDIQLCHDMAVERESGAEGAILVFKQATA